MLLPILQAVGHAQATSAITGVVIDAATRTPVPGVEVRVRSQSGVVLTDSLGRFVIRGLLAGFEVVHARRLGYMALDDTATLIAGAETVRELRLTSQPTVVLDTVRTVGEKKKYISPGLRDFEERRTKGIGQFISAEVLRKYDHTTMASALRRLPGTRVTAYRASSYLSSTRGRGSIARALPRAEPSDPQSPRGCWVAVYVDGVAIYVGEASLPAPDFQRLQVREYAGVEYYAGGASVPAQYSGVKASDCGVLLLWTRER